MPWLMRIEPLVRPLFRVYARATRGLTLGVRGLVVDDEGRVLLIEHTYVPGWHLPGGGVERGETAHAALARELVEEAGVEMIGPARLVSVHDNHARFRGDHVLLYRIGDWRAVAATSRGEIARIGWFAPGDLPPETTGPTRQRIAEALDGADTDLRW